LSRASSELCDFSVWVDSAVNTRRERLKARDGSQFDEFWPTWTIQEDEFYQAEKSKELADLVISN
jgi:dephospho-CoA kinase